MLFKKTPIVKDTIIQKLLMHIVNELNRIDNQLRKTINLNRQLLDVKCYSISRIGSDLC